jgi:glycosyltransferase involved in cell wall biosynthesis
MNTSEASPRVLFVDLSRQFGGASSRVLGLLSAMPAEEAGLAAIAGSPVFEQARKMGLRVHPVGSGKTDWRILPNLMQVIRENRYQVLDTQNIQSKVWGALAAWWSGTALVSTLNSWYRFEHGTNIKGWFYTKLELLTNFQLDGYIVVSETVRDALAAASKNVPLIELIYNAIGLDSQKIPGDRAWLNSKFGLPENGLVCISVGRLVWAKGYEDLIEAMRLLAAECSNLYCLVLGDGELRADLESTIQERGLHQRVILAGYQPRETVLSALKVSDIFVMPSRQEGTPIALLEAAALGVPILATSCGGIPEMVTDGQQALLVQPGDTQALAKALLRLVEDEHLRRELSQSAQMHVSQKFSLEAQVRASSDVYRRALAHHQSRR